MQVTLRDFQGYIRKDLSASTVGLWRCSLSVYSLAERTHQSCFHRQHCMSCQRTPSTNCQPRVILHIQLRWPKLLPISRHNYLSRTIFKFLTYKNYENKSIVLSLLNYGTIGYRDYQNIWTNFKLLEFV